MKKIIVLLSTLVLTSSIPLFAAFCSNCGKNMPDEANFCPNCGKAATGAFQTAVPEDNIQTSDSNTVAVIDSKVKADNKSLADYHFINRIEEYLTESTSNVAYRQCLELKRQNAAKLQKMDDEYMNYSIYRRKIHDLHMGKLQALENYLEARREADRGGDIGRAKSQMDKQLFIIDKMNNAIDTLLCGGNSLSNINKVEELEKRVKKTTANYIVTSSYLTLGDVRVRRNEPIWIEDVSGASAKVHHMGGGYGDKPAVGYVSIYDLEKRSNWTPDSDFFYSTPSGSTVVLTQPVRPEPTVNVVVWDGIYPYRRWHHWGPTPPPPHRPKGPPMHPPAPTRRIPGGAPPPSAPNRSGGHKSPPPPPRK